MAKVKNVYVIMTAIVAIIIMTITATFLVGTRGPSTVETRYDIAPIRRRLPDIAISEVIWQSSVFGSHFGQSEYWLTGYIVLDETENRRISSLVGWDTDESWSPSFVPDEIGATDDVWLVSEAFDKKHIGELLFIVDFHYLPSRGLLYFYAETN